MKSSGKTEVDERIGHVSEVLTEEQKRRGLIIHSLQHIQKKYNYLPEEKLQELAEELELPLTDIYSTASFYKHFYFKPRGRNIVSVCTGTACHVRGAGKIVKAVKDEFGIGEGETTEDMSLTLETVGCVGCCGLAPVITVNEEVVGEVDVEKFANLSEGIRKGDGE